MFPAFLIFAAAAAVPAELSEPDPKAMSYAEIKLFNAKVPRNHPYYIRCVKSAAIGSLVARRVSCRTNAQWDKSDRVGNDEARDVMVRTTSKAWNTSG